MLRNTFFALVALLATAASTQAALVLQSDAGTPLALGGLTKYTISAVGTAGELINTFTNPVIVAGAGSLAPHQIWQGAAPPGSPTPTVEQQSGIWDPSWKDYDTAYLFNNAAHALVLGNFTEANDNATAASVGANLPKFAAVFGPASSGYGAVTSGGGDSRVLATAQNSVAFYQIVLRSTDKALFDIRLDGRTAQNAPTFQVIDDFCVGVCGPVGTAPNVNPLNIPNHHAVDDSPAAGVVTQTGGTDPITWGGFTFVSYTPNYGGMGDGAGKAATATFNTGNQQFSWNTAQGAPRGDYVWQVTASNAAGSDNGLITVNVTEVPEPTTFALCGLALVGACGLIRRRS